MNRRVIEAVIEQLEKHSQNLGSKTCNDLDMPMEQWRVDLFNKHVEDGSFALEYKPSKPQLTTYDFMWVDALVRELKQMIAEVTGWKPIATAPQDGTRILLRAWRPYLPVEKGQDYREAIASGYWLDKWLLDAQCCSNLSGPDDYLDFDPIEWKEL